MSLVICEFGYVFLQLNLIGVAIAKGEYVSSPSWKATGFYCFFIHINEPAMRGHLSEGFFFN